MKDQEHASLEDQEHMASARCSSGLQRLVLLVLDGWGLRSPFRDNAISLADTPTMDGLWERCPKLRLSCAGADVGLPAGQMGNSEVGHLNIGAGRVVLQGLARFDADLASGLEHNGVFQDFCARLRKSGGRMHLVGLLSGGGVHGHLRHMALFTRAAAKACVEVLVHAFLDGRDTPPRSALEELRVFRKLSGGVSPTTLCGRYYAMDRDKRYARTRKAWSLLVSGEGVPSPDAEQAMHASQTGDEFFLPHNIGRYRGMRAGDGLMVANFRADRIRQILQALLVPGFDAFARPRMPPLTAALGMTDYAEDLRAYITPLFPGRPVAHTLGEILSKAGRPQLRIAESEKYPHVTYFFNGGREQPFALEERILVPSPKVATYDRQPRMSALQLTARLCNAIESRRFSFVLGNYANCDMVGHTGFLNATIQAVSTVDGCLTRVVAVCRRSPGTALLITADHGNAEQMLDSRGKTPHTAHTLSEVPCILAAGPSQTRAVSSRGKLADIAPSVLALMGLEKPTEMDGNVLFV